MNRIILRRPSTEPKALDGGPACNRTAGPLIGLLSVLLCLTLAQGCARLQKKPPVETTPRKVQPVPLQNYAEFIQQNMDHINAVYSTDYAPYVFVVDTDRGSRPVQALLEPEAVAGLADRLNRHARSNSVKVANIYNHVIDHFRYHPMPHQWEPVSEVVRSGRGDCKGLSLLLLALLTASDIRARAAVSNGHMWVNAFYDRKWHVLEPDTDSERADIYALPGFYTYPLYRIYPDRTSKRVPLQRP